MTTTERSYHHGDLPQALRRSAADVIAERGAAGFSLREVARRAGVSHAAPAHHFGDATGLLTAVAVEAFEHLHLAMQSAATESDQGDSVAMLRQMGRAYVELGASHPGHCAIMFRSDLVDADNPSYQEAGDAAFANLVDCVEHYAEQFHPDLDIALASLSLWAAMQGLLELYPTMAKMSEDAADSSVKSRGIPSDLPAIGDLAEAVTQTIVDGFRPQT